MECRELRFSAHALGRMSERGVSPADVRQLVDTGEVIENYPAISPSRACCFLARPRGECCTRSSLATPRAAGASW